jgi:hypothetical protein
LEDLKERVHLEDLLLITKEISDLAKHRSFAAGFKRETQNSKKNIHVVSSSLDSYVRVNES